MAPINLKMKAISQTLERMRDGVRKVTGKNKRTKLRRMMFVDFNPKNNLLYGKMTKIFRMDINLLVKNSKDNTNKRRGHI